jgi:hypothetical protein
VLFAVLTLATAGCRPADEFAPVNGRLRIRGEPAANVLVVFTPESTADHVAPRSVGVTEDDGRYTLRSEQNRAGAVVGRHRVTLEDMNVYAVERSERPPTASNPTPTSRLTKEYSAVTTTPLERRVVAGPQEIDLDVPHAAK